MGYYGFTNEEVRTADLRVNPYRKNGVLELGNCSDGDVLRLLAKSREETNRVIEQMAERGIATNVHYKPLPMMKAYRSMGFDIADYPNAYHLFENEITLPLHTRLTDEDVDYVINNFIDIVKKL